MAVYTQRMPGFIKENVLWQAGAGRTEAVDVNQGLDVPMVLKSVRGDIVMDRIQAYVCGSGSHPVPAKFIKGI